MSEKPTIEEHAKNMEDAWRSAEEQNIIFSRKIDALKGAVRSAVQQCNDKDDDYAALERMYIQHRDECERLREELNKAEDTIRIANETYKLTMRDITLAEENERLGKYGQQLATVVESEHGCCDIIDDWEQALGQADVTLTAKCRELGTEEARKRQEIMRNESLERIR